MPLLITISPDDTVTLTDDNGNKSIIKARRYGPHSDRVQVSIDAPDSVKIDRRKFDRSGRRGYLDD